MIGALKAAGKFIGNRVKENLKDSPGGQALGAFRSWKEKRDQAKAAKAKNAAAPDFQMNSAKPAASEGFKPGSIKTTLDNPLKQKNNWFKAKNAGTFGDF